MNTSKWAGGCIWGISVSLDGVWVPIYILCYQPTHLCSDKNIEGPTVYPKKYAQGFVVLCFVVVMQSFIINSHEIFIHIHQGCFADTGAIVRLPQCQWSKPDEYGEISQCITTTKHSKAKTVCIFLGIYCRMHAMVPLPKPDNGWWFICPISSWWYEVHIFS